MQVVTCEVSRFHSYINSAKDILASYKGSEPFASFIKKYFAANKKFGSNDRKQVANLCYCYFRMGKEAPPPPKGGNWESSLIFERIILAGLLLCSKKSNETLEALKPEWNEKTGLSINEKLSLVNYQLSSVFPWEKELSEGIEYEKFSASFFVQPDLFLRIRPGYAQKIFLKIDDAEIPYEFISPFSIRLANNFKAEDLFEINKEVVIQDYNSQQVLEHFFESKDGKSFTVWDCCAGSGGKSIMVHDIFPDANLTVSDVRESILTNLRKRFKQAGINKYNSFNIDLTKPAAFKISPVDFIIADVPCSGSGTWGRTPEQLYFFDEKRIEEYSSLQKSILSNVISHIKPGGHLLYITCSVFKKENEEVVNWIKEEFHFELTKMELFKGYSLKADTMFAALLQKPL